MCAIFGTRKLTMFEVLYDANRHRGVFASSVCKLKRDKHNSIVITMKPGDHSFESKDFITTGVKYFLGHVQAPTSTKQTWDITTSHPFSTKDWLVAHNGVLTNFPELNKKYCSRNTNPVDTSVIVNMLQQESEDKKKTETDVLEIVFSRLQGTFACFIINRQTQNVYLTRQGSTLFFNDNGDFSSVKGLTMSEVPEGVIFQLGKKKFEQVGAFKADSPFFVL